MSEHKEELVNAVIEMIKHRLVIDGDWSCLYDLLYYNVDENTLKEYLPEEEEVGEDFCQACEDGTCSELTTEEDESC
jgi:hypothetical protein